MDLGKKVRVGKESEPIKAPDLTPSTTPIPLPDELDFTKVPIRAPDRDVQK